MFELKNIMYQDFLNIKNIKIPLDAFIYGESGSGKSTLLRLLSTIGTQKTGEVFLDGINLNTVDPIAFRKKVMMQPQKGVKFGETLYEDLETVASFQGKAMFSEQKIKEIFSVVCMDKDIHGTTDYLSGGELQRFSLARMLLLEPEILLLDEPTSALDVDTQQAVMDNLFTYTKIHNQRLCIVTHAQELLTQYPLNKIFVENGSCQLVEGL